MNRNVGLKPISDRKRDKLAAAGITHPSNTFAKPDPPAAVKTTRRATKRPADTGPDQASVERALERDHWSCVVCGEPLHGNRGSEWSVHHRKLRSQGGDNRLSNLVSVCGHGTVGCHSEIHASPKRARDVGWIVLRDEDPAAKPMAHSQHGWVLLENEGSWAKTEPPHDLMEAQIGAGKEF